MDIYTLYKSNQKNKKFKILLPNNKWIHFGSSNYEDYTMHKNDNRKKNYIARHSAIKLKDGSRAIDNINSPAFWSLNLLWNKPTLTGSIRDTQKRYNITVLKQV